jgi:hypothetical protein
MAEAGIRDYPRDEIIQHHAELQQLLLDMAARSAGGRRASGRYKAYDTARLLYIKTVAFPSLRLGKRIDTEDWRLLFLPITSRDDNGSASDKTAGASSIKKILAPSHPSRMDPGEIKVVVSTEQCDSACGDLLAGSELYWDTESVAYLDGSGTNTNTAALVQICSGDGVCYLCRVALWPACYPSFTELMANNQHKVGHDVADLQRRFPDLVINGAVDLKERIGCLSLSSHALHKMIDQQFGMVGQALRPSALGVRAPACCA